MPLIIYNSSYNAKTPSTTIKLIEDHNFILISNCNDDYINIPILDTEHLKIPGTKAQGTEVSIREELIIYPICMKLPTSTIISPLNK